MRTSNGRDSGYKPPCKALWALGQRGLHGYLDIERELGALSVRINVLTHRFAIQIIYKLSISIRADCGPNAL